MQYSSSKSGPLKMHRDSPAWSVHTPSTTVWVEHEPPKTQLAGQDESVPVGVVVCVVVVLGGAVVDDVRPYVGKVGSPIVKYGGVMNGAYPNVVVEDSGAVVVVVVVGCVVVDVDVDNTVDAVVDGAVVDVVADTVDAVVNEDVVDVDDVQLAALVPVTLSEQ
jgi:hypothetical protein